MTLDGRKTEHLCGEVVLSKSTLGDVMTFRARQITSFMFSSRGGGDG